MPKNHQNPKGSAARQMALMRLGLVPEKMLLPAWLSPSGARACEKDEVHVWRSYLKIPSSQMEMMRQTLSSDELERADRFHFPQGRAHFIAARGTLRAILGKYLHMEPDKVRFRYGPFGKPALANAADEEMISFSVSHSNGMAVYAFALNRKIGVDMEYISSSPAIASIAEQFFTPQESLRMRSLPGHIRRKAFFRTWTRNEAYLKAMGTGFAKTRDIREINVEGQWSFTNIHIASGYAACLAVEGQEPGLQCLQWTGSLNE